MTFAGHDDSDRALDYILEIGEAEELARIRTGLNLDAGLAAISPSGSGGRPPLTDRQDSGEPHILTERRKRRERSRILPDRTEHCVLFAVDVIGFGDRRADDQLLLRDRLYAILTAAFEGAEIGWDNCHREDRGDGLLVIIPTHMTSATVVGPLLDRLRAGLRQHNRTAGRTPGIRLRAAVHSGSVHMDKYGVSGSAVVHLFRLLDAPALKKALAESSAELALVASDPFYRGLTDRTLGDIDPERFQPAMVEVKETLALGWLHLPLSTPRIPGQPPPQPGPATGGPARTSEAERQSAEVRAAPEILSFRWVR